MTEMQEQQLTCVTGMPEQFPEKDAQAPKWQEGQKPRVALQLLPAEPPGKPSAFRTRAVRKTGCLSRGGAGPALK